MLFIAAALLLLGGMIDVRAIRRDNPVILDTTLYSDWAYIYKIDLPMSGVYDLEFTCGADEYAYAKGLAGPNVVHVRVTTNIPKQPSCFISRYERRQAVDAGTPDAG